MVQLLLEAVGPSGVHGLGFVFRVYVYRCREPMQQHPRRFTFDLNKPGQEYAC